MSAPGPTMVESTVDALRSTVGRMPPDALAQVDGVGAIVRGLVEDEGYEWNEENARLMLLGIILVKGRLDGVGEQFMPLLEPVLNEIAAALSPALLGKAGPDRDYLGELERMASNHRAGGFWLGLGRAVARGLGLRPPEAQ